MRNLYSSGVLPRRWVLLGALACALAVPTSTCASLRAQETPAGAPAGAGATIELGDKVPSLLLLDEESQGWSLQVTSKSRLNVKAGDVVVNSTIDGALWNADGTIEAAGAIRVSGGVTNLGRHSTRPEPETGASAFFDPVPAFRIAPGRVASQDKMFINNRKSLALKPGIYNGGLFATGQGTVITMAPGIYIMNSGDLYLSGVTLRGSDVTIVMGGEQPGRFWLGQDSAVELAAPTAGPLRDIVLISRAAGWSMIQSDGGKGSIKGLVYAPTAGIGLSASSDLILDRVICLNLSMALESKLEITGRALTLTKPEATPAEAGKG